MRVLMRPISLCGQPSITFHVVSFEDAMKTETKIGFLLMSLVGCAAVLCGVLYFSYGQDLSGTFLIILGFIIEVFSVVVYVEEMTK